VQAPPEASGARKRGYNFVNCHRIAQASEEIPVSEIIDFSSFVSGKGAGTGGAGAGGQGAGASGLIGVTPTASGAADAAGGVAPGTASSRSFPAQDGLPAVDLTTTADYHAHLVIHADRSQVAKAVEQADVIVARSVGVDIRDLGMMEELKGQLGADNYDALVTTVVQRTLYAEAVERTGIEPFLPETMLNDDPVDPKSDYTLRVDVLLHPKVELSSYDPVEVEFPKKADVTSADVSDFIDRLSQQLATAQPDPSRTEAQQGDDVLLSITMTSDVPGVQELHNQRETYRMGSGALGDDFDRNVAGMKVGETREFSMSLPTGAPDSSGGSFAVVKMKVRLVEVDRLVPATINDAWVMENAPQAKTLLGFRQMIRTTLEREHEAAFHDDMLDVTAAELAKRLRWDVPLDFIEASRREFMDRFVRELALSGVTLEQYKASPDFDQQAFDAEIEKQSIEHLREALSLDALADHRNIQVSDAEAAKVLSAGADDRMQQLLSAQRGQGGDAEAIRQLARRRMANEWLVKTAKDSSGPHLQLV
jgi:trigger factor